MPRRLTVIVRRGLLVAGVLLLLGLPVSYRYLAGLKRPSLHQIAAVNGYLAIAHYEHDFDMGESFEPYRPFFAQPATSPAEWRDALLPRLSRQSVTVMVETEPGPDDWFPLLAAAGGEAPTTRATPATPSGRSFVTFPATRRTLQLPLGPLAGACLAWPVASFLLARRRNGRGFPVEGAKAETGSGPPINASLPPKPAQEHPWQTLRER